MKKNIFETNAIYANLFFCLSSLSKNLMGMFNLIYFYKQGFSLSEVVLWRLVVYFCYCIFQPLLLKLGYKFSNKILALISFFFFIVTYVQMIFFVNSFFSFVLNAIFFTIYTSFYWNLKHSLEFNSISDTKIGKKVGTILIIGQIAEILAALLSGFILDYYNILLLFGISNIFMLSSIFFIFKLEENKKEKINHSLITYLKIIPKTTLFHIFLKEASTIMTNFFSLYLFLYVSNTYSFAGITNFFLGLSSIVFIYFISKRIDQKREDYLLVSTILLCLIYLFKINISTEAILIVIFFEGLIKQFFGVVSNNNYYLLGCSMNKNCYICINEIIINISRIIILIIGFFLTGSLPKLMYFCIGLLVLSGFVPFKIEQKNNTKL